MEEPQPEHCEDDFPCEEPYLERPLGDDVPADDAVPIPEEFVTESIVEEEDDDIHWESLLGNADELQSPLLDEIIAETGQLEEIAQDSSIDDDPDQADQDILESLRSSMDALMSEESPSVADELPGPLTETTDFPSDTDRHLSEAEGENDLPPDADEEPWSDMAGETDIFAEDAFGPQDESMVLPTDTLVLLKQFGFCDEELESAADQSTNLRELSAGHSSDPATNPQDHAQDDVAGIDDDIVLPIESVEPSLEGHAEEGNDEEVTIEDYMNQLLRGSAMAPRKRSRSPRRPRQNQRQNRMWLS